MSKRVTELIEKYDDDIRANNGFGFHFFLTDAHAVFNDFDKQELAQLQTAILNYGEIHAFNSFRGIVNCALTLFYDDFLSEGDEYGLERDVFNITAMYDLGLADPELMSKYFSEFNAWMGRLGKMEKRVINGELKYNGLLERAYSF